MWYTRVYEYNYKQNITAVLLHVVGTQVEIQYTAVRVHVPGKYYIYTSQQQTATAAIVL